MLKEFTERMSQLGGKKLFGVKVVTETNNEKRVPIHPFFKETFKVMDMLEREKERRLYEPSYEERLKMLQKYEGSIQSEEELEEYENEERRIKRLIRLGHSPMRITIPEDKYEVILDNYETENKEATAHQESLLEEKRKVDAEVEELLMKQANLNQEINTNRKLIGKAKVLKETLEHEGRSFDVGTTASERFAGKPPSYYEDAEHGLRQLGGSIETYKTIKNGDDK